MNSEPMLEKGNIMLRAPEPEDVDFLYQMENDNRLWHLSNTLTPFSRFDLEQYVLLQDKDLFSVKQARFIIVLKNEDHEPVGTVDLFDFEPQHQRAGVGIMVMEQYRNKGVATTALEVLIEYAFNHLGLHQLYCNIEEDNHLSLKLFQKTGFEICGKKIEWNRRGDRWINEYLLQLINKK